MNLKFCKNIGEKEYELLLHGIVGEEIVGRDVAMEIMYLDSIGAKCITERINTVGGSVVDAFSIVSANFSAKCKIKTINEGVSDSSGSFILASGDKGERYAMDYSSMLLHNISYCGIMMDDIEDEGLKAELQIMQGSIIKILSNNSGKSEKEIGEIMAKSTRFSAKEAKANGFIDNIISTKKKPKITENMSVMEIMNVCRDGNFNDNNKNNDMKSVLSYLNLNENATEASALTAVQSIENRAKDAEKKVGNLTSEIGDLKNQVSEKDGIIAEYKAKVTAFENKEQKNAVDSAISSGKFAEEQREALDAQVKVMGVENFNNMIAMITIPHADAAGKVDNQGGKSGNKSEKDLAAEYQNLAENNTAELNRIKNEEPARFDKMFAAWDKN